MSVYYKGKRLIECNYVEYTVKGIEYINNTLYVDNYTLRATEINVVGDAVCTYLSLNDSYIELSGCTGEIEISCANSNAGIIMSSVDNLKVQGMDANVRLNLDEGTVDLSECEGSVNLIDNFTNQHDVVAENLIPENIKKGVTILGVTGTYEG